MYVDKNELIIMYYALIMKMNELLTKQTFITQIQLKSTYRKLTKNIY